MSPAAIEPSGGDRLAREHNRSAGAPAQDGGVAAASPVGLTSAEACRRLGEFGPNAVAEKGVPLWRGFLAKFWSPVPWMLEAAFILQLGLGEYVEATVIAALLFNATLGFIQESRAGAALAALKQRLAPTALARRDGEWVSRHPNSCPAMRSGCSSAPWFPPMRPSFPDRCWSTNRCSPGSPCPSMRVAAAKSTLARWCAEARRWPR